MRHTVRAFDHLQDRGGVEGDQGKDLRTSEERGWVGCSLKESIAPRNVKIRIKLIHLPNISQEVHATSGGQPSAEEETQGETEGIMAFQQINKRGK